MQANTFAVQRQKFPVLVGFLRGEGIQQIEITTPIGNVHTNESR
jgi:hypothetical protein